MTINTILLPTDFSTISDTAVESATSLAQATNAKLLIVHVEEPPHLYDGEFYYGMMEPQTDKLKELLHEIKPTDPEVPYKHILGNGEPTQEINRIAEENQADLIVMATHGRRGLSRVVLGSVAEAVLRNASCPVLMCKSPVKK